MSSFSAGSIAATGMGVAVEQTNVIANNIANANTTAFKRYFLQSADLSYQYDKRGGVAEAEGGEPRPVGIVTGSGAKVAGIYRVAERGQPQNTGNPLHMAIIGNGYFRVTLPNGRAAYTRAGSFFRTPEGQIATIEGYTLVSQPGIADVNVNLESVQINQSGEITYVNNDGATVDGGQIDLAYFANEAGLEALGDNLYLATDASGDAQVDNPGAAPLGIILHKNLEMSNVNPVDEMTRLIAAQRLFELASKVVRADDEMRRAVNEIK